MSKAVHEGTAKPPRPSVSGVSRHANSTGSAILSSTDKYENLKLPKGSSGQTRKLVLLGGRCSYRVVAVFADHSSCEQSHLGEKMVLVALQFR